MALKKILGIFGWLGTGLVMAAVIVRLVRPELQPVWNGLALAGLGCVLVYLASQWREIATAMGARSAKYGALSAASVLLVLGIVIGVNYIGARQNKRWDLTAAGEYTLSDQTRRVLEGLKEPIQLKVFDRTDGFQRFRDRLDGYTYVTPQVKVEYVDVDKNPAQARQYEVQQYGTVVIEYQGRRERVTTDTEQDITNGIIKTVEGKQKKAYFVQGHGEKDPTSADERTGYNTIATAMGRDNLQVEKLVLAQQPTIPADASTLIIAGPTADFLQPEIESLRNYMNKGGKVLVMLDPPEGPNQPTPNLIAFLKEWGVDVGDNVVVDVSGVGQLLGAGPSMPVAASYPEHAITQRFSVITAYPLARSVGSTPQSSDGRFAQTFIQTSTQSWAEADLKALGTGTEVSMDEKAGDRPGPVSIGAAVEVDAPEQPNTSPDKPKPTPAELLQNHDPKVQTRLAVIGDSDFPSNGFLGISGNRDMFLNTVNWLAEQENLIAIRPREAADRRLTLTAERQRFTLYAVFAIPLLVFGAGVVTWWRRR